MIARIVRWWRVRRFKRYECLWCSYPFGDCAEEYRMRGLHAGKFPGKGCPKAFALHGRGREQEMALRFFGL